MSEVKLPLEQDGYNAYAEVDGKRVPVLSTSMGNCWGQDDQRDFCAHIIHCVNNFERVASLLEQCASELADEIEGKYHGILGYPSTDRDYKADMAVVKEARALLAELDTKTEQKQ